VFLKAGQTQTVSIPLGHGAFEYYQPDQKQWVGDKDNFTILVGSSSRDLALHDDYLLPDALADKD